MDDENSAELLEEWRQGNEQAAEEIFQRYVERLIALARSRLSAKLSRRLDPEDVVQSAYRSFFRQARDDRYALRRSGDLWRLLAAITLNKLHGQIEYHTAQKRAVDQEENAPADRSLFSVRPDAVARGPSPSEALAVVEELEEVMRGLDAVHRRILELRLQGQSVEEIAEDVQRSERTVRRVLEKVKTELNQRLNPAGD